MNIVRMGVSSVTLMDVPVVKLQAKGIYIGRPIYISDVQYPCPSPSRGIVYRTSDIDFGNIGVILSQTAPHRLVCR